VVPSLVEASEFTDVVHLHLVRTIAELAPVGEQLWEPLLAPGWGRICVAVSENCVALPFEWYAAEPCDECFCPHHAQCCTEGACTTAERQTGAGTSDITFAPPDAAITYAAVGRNR
jgi:hypothetical protein